MSKHTPGPWKIGGGLIYAEGVNAPVEIATVHSYCRDNLRRHSPAQTIADSNARLIAAAPELIDALRECVNALANGRDAETRRHAAQIAVDAIDKAEGRA